MEKFYHINNKGIPSECKAKSPEKCRFHGKHFDDYNKALEYADSINEQIKKVNSKNVLKFIHKDKDLIPRLLPLFKNEKFIQESVNKYNKIEFITSTDLINKGIKPGKEFGKLLKELQNKQLQGKSKEEILKNI